MSSSVFRKLIAGFLLLALFTTVKVWHWLEVEQDARVMFLSSLHTLPDYRERRERIVRLFFTGHREFFGRNFTTNLLSRNGVYFNNALYTRQVFTLMEESARREGDFVLAEDLIRLQEQLGGELSRESALKRYLLARARDLPPEEVPLDAVDEYVQPSPMPAAQFAVATKVSPESESDLRKGGLLDLFYFASSKDADWAEGCQIVVSSILPRKLDWSLHEASGVVVATISFDSKNLVDMATATRVDATREAAEFCIRSASGKEATPDFSIRPAANPAMCDCTDFVPGKPTATKKPAKVTTKKKIATTGKKSSKQKSKHTPKRHSTTGRIRK